MTATDRTKVIFAADSTNECVATVRQYLQDNFDTTFVDDAQQWTEISEIVGRAVAAGEYRYGVLMCWTGTGTAIVANKIPGVRAALCWEPWIAEGARLWNDANVITLSLKRTAPDVAVDTLKAFFAVTAPDPEEVPLIDSIRDR